MKSSGLIHDFLKSRDHDKKEVSNSRSTYLTKIVLYSIFVQRSRFWGYFLSFFRNMNRKLVKNKKNWKKAIAFFQGVLIAQKWLIIQPRPLVHNNQNVGLNMGFYSGFFKKSSIFGWKCRKWKCKIFQEKRGHDVFDPKISCTFVWGIRFWNLNVQMFKIWRLPWRHATDLGTRIP